MMTDKYNTKLLSKCLKKIGVPLNLSGYRYMKDALQIILDHPDYIRHITKDIYPEVAKNNNTTSSRVERAIRNAIETTWKRGSKEEIDRIFINTCDPAKGKPTNSEFLCTLAEAIREGEI